MSFCLSNILTRGHECPNCGETNEGHLPTCAACGAVLHEEERPVSIAPAATALQPDVDHGVALTPEQQAIVEQMRTKIPLERGANYKLFKEALDGALSGEISKDNYRQTVRKLKNIGDSGRKVLEHAVVSKKIAAVSEEAQAVQSLMLSGFRQIFEGSVQMESWLSCHDMDDLLGGAALVDSGYHAIDEAQDRALLLD